MPDPYNVDEAPELKPGPELEEALRRLDEKLSEIRSKELAPPEREGLDPDKLALDARAGIAASPGDSKWKEITVAAHAALDKILAALEAEGRRTEGLVEWAAKERPLPDGWVIIHRDCQQAERDRLAVATEALEEIDGDCLFSTPCLEVAASLGGDPPDGICERCEARRALARIQGGDRG